MLVCQVVSVNPKTARLIYTVALILDFASAALGCLAGRGRES
jgi:hypothetical protein